MSRFALRDLVACVERELRMRERVYPRWVDSGRTTKAHADQELALMRAVLENLRDQAHGAPAAPPPQGKLFT